MADRRVREVGAVRWIRLRTNERVSQCGRYIVEPPGRRLTERVPRGWTAWYRDPEDLTVYWALPLYTGKHLGPVLEAIAVFDRATRAQSSKVPADETPRERVQRLQAKRTAALTAVAQWERTRG